MICCVFRGFPGWIEAEKKAEVPAVDNQVAEEAEVGGASVLTQCCLFIFMVTTVALAVAIMLPVLKLEPWSDPQLAFHLAKTQILRAVDISQEFPQIALTAAVREGDVEVTAALIQKKGVSVEYSDEQAYMTPLHIATDRTDLAMLNVLLSKADSANARDGIGYSLLHWAAYRPWVEGVEALLKAGADVNIPVSSSETTPLHFSAISSFEASKLLIEAGADVNAVSAVGMTPFLSALTRGQLQTAELLIERGAKVNVVAHDGTNNMLAAAVSGSLPTLELAYKLPGADIKSKYPTGESVFHLVFFSGSESAADWVIAQGGLDLSAAKGMTPVEFAVRNGWLSGLKLLLANGADVKTDNARLQEIANKIEAHEIAELLASTAFIGSSIPLNPSA